MQMTKLSIKSFEINRFRNKDIYNEETRRLYRLLD